jgi:hypothetical protein
VTFLWADAWILHALAVATQSGPATLSELIEAMDMVNHALPVERELHGGLTRLQESGYIEEVGERFALTSQVPAHIVERCRVEGSLGGHEVAAAFLDVRPTTTSNAWDDPSNDVTFPTLTHERLLRADDEYRRRFRREYRRSSQSGPRKAEQ